MIYTLKKRTSFRAKPKESTFSLYFFAAPFTVLWKRAQLNGHYRKNICMREYKIRALHYACSTIFLLYICLHMCVFCVYIFLEFIALFVKFRLSTTTILIFSLDGLVFPWSLFYWFLLSNHDQYEFEAPFITSQCSLWIWEWKNSTNANIYYSSSFVIFFF